MRTVVTTYIFLIFLFVPICIYYILFISSSPPFLLYYIRSVTIASLGNNISQWACKLEIELILSHHLLDLVYALCREINECIMKVNCFLLYGKPDVIKVVGWKFKYGKSGQCENELPEVDCVK